MKSRASRAENLIATSVYLAHLVRKTMSECLTPHARKLQFHPRLSLITNGKSQNASRIMREILSRTSRERSSNHARVHRSHHTRRSLQPHHSSPSITRGKYLNRIRIDHVSRIACAITIHRALPAENLGIQYTTNAEHPDYIQRNLTSISDFHDGLPAKGKLLDQYKTCDIVHRSMRSTPPC